MVIYVAHTSVNTDYMYKSLGARDTRNQHETCVASTRARLWLLRVTELALCCCRRLVTCGHDCDVRVFEGVEEDECLEFSVSSEKVSALTTYQREGKEIVAIAMDNNTVQAYTVEVSMFTKELTCVMFHLC